MTALVSPWAILFLFCLCLILLFFRKYKTVLILFIAALGINLLSKCFAMHLIAKYSEESLKVLAFNANANDKSLAKVGSIAEVILKQNADVVFLSEDFNSFADSLDNLLKETYSYDSYKTGDKSRGHFFYSKFPFSLEHLGEIDGHYSLIYRASVNMDRDSVMIYGCHFASNNYNENNDYVHPNSIESMEGFKDYISDIELASAFRQKQAQSLVDDMNPGKTIVMGDMNDVSGSRPLRILERAGLSDAWWKGGIGYGATIHKPLPYRIDHIMYSDGLRLKGIKKVDANGLSDHDALVAEFEIE